MSRSGSNGPPPTGTPPTSGGFARRLLRGAAAGALLGAALFAGDLAALFVTHGERFAPRTEGWLLLGIVGLFAVVPGLAVGAVAWGLAPRALRARVPRWGLPAGALVLGLAAFGHGLQKRSEEVEPLPPRTASAERPYHVLWILLDTLRADTLYGPDLDFPHAPAIGRLARESVLFTDAESSAGWTIPSTASLLTGIHPVALGAERGLLPAWAPTAAERLAAAGYETRCFMDNALLDRTNGFGAGFETFFKRSPMEFAWRLRAQRLMPVGLADRLRHGLHVSYAGAEELTDAALEALEEERDRPLFLYAHYMDVHTPYRFHPDVRPVPPGAEDLPLLDRALRHQMRSDESLAGEDQTRTMRILYETELAYMDAHVGRLVEAFYARCGADRSVVVLTSDHGEEFYEHGSFGHGMTLYKELVHVPLLVRLPPDLRPPGPDGEPFVFSHPVRLVDVLPTTLEVLGLPAAFPGSSVEIQGVSLLPYLAGGEAPPTEPLFASQDRFRRRIFRWREGGLAFVRTTHKRTGTTTELYDKEADYPELVDLVPGEAGEEGRAASLQARLEEFLVRQHALRDPGELGVSRDVDALRALGYVGE